MSFVSCAKLNAELALKQGVLNGCDGNPLAAGTEMATCADLDAAIAGVSIADATDTIKGISALNAGTSLPGDATNCTDALTACGLNALLTDATVGGNTVITNVKALIPLATTTVAGLIEEATGEETRLGATDANRADRAVTPESMSYALQTAQDYPIDVRSSARASTANFFKTGGSSGYGVQGALLGVTSVTAPPTGMVASAGYIDSTSSAPAGTSLCGSSGEIYASGAGNKNALYGIAAGTGGTNIGVYGTAANGATNWAGYFDGNVIGTARANFAGNTGIGFSTNSPVPLRVVAPGTTDIGYEVNRVGSTTVNVQAYDRTAGLYGNLWQYASQHRFLVTSNGGGTPSSLTMTATGGGTSSLSAFDGVVTVTGSVTASSYITSSDETLKENVEDIDAAKALQFRNGLQWKKYELFSEQQVEIMEEVTEEVQKTDAAGNPVVDADGNPVMETVTKQVGTGRYEVKRNSQGIKRGLIAQEVQALAQSIGDFSDVVVEVGEYFTLDAQGYPVKDAQGNNIVNKRLGIDYDAIQFVICAGEQSLLPAVV